MAAQGCNYDSFLMTLRTSKHRKRICTYFSHNQKGYIINMDYVRKQKFVRTLCTFKHFLDFLFNSLLSKSEHTMDILWAHSLHTLDTLWTKSGHTWHSLGILWAYSDSTQKSIGEHTENSHFSGRAHPHPSTFYLV